MWRILNLKNIAQICFPLHIIINSSEELKLVFRLVSHHYPGWNGYNKSMHNKKIFFSEIHDCCFPYRIRLSFFQYAAHFPDCFLFFPYPFLMNGFPKRKKYQDAKYSWNVDYALADECQVSSSWEKISTHCILLVSPFYPYNIYQLSCTLEIVLPIIECNSDIY